MTLDRFAESRAAGIGIPQRRRTVAQFHPVGLEMFVGDTKSA